MSFTVIPAIDIIGGKCVRLSQGDYSLKVIYNDDPLDVAQQFEVAGFTHLHLVDLDGAKAGSIVNIDVLHRIATGTSLLIDYGGGLKTVEDVERVLNAGASWATIGSVAVKQPETLKSMAAAVGAEKLFIGADVKGEQVATHGWQQVSELDIYSFIAQLLQTGIERIFCTDIATDGMLSGPGIEIYTRILERFPGLNLTASGGVASVEDVDALQQLGCAGVIVGKAIYEQYVSIEELVIRNQN